MCVQAKVMLQGKSTKALDPGAWATGIVEVALPVEYKMRNIEETEAAKRQLLHATRYVHKVQWPSTTLGSQVVGLPHES